MLDMSGYKIDQDKGDDDASGADGVSLPNDALDEKAEEEIIAFTQGLLQSTDPKTLRNFFDPSDERSSRAASPEPPDLDKSPVQAAVSPKSRSRAGSRASSPPRPLSISSLQSIHADIDNVPSPTDGVYHASPRQFTLKSGGKLYVFELSLCGGEDFGQDKARWMS